MSSCCFKGLDIHVVALLGGLKLCFLAFILYTIITRFTRQEHPDLQFREVALEMQLEFVLCEFQFLS
mgnify:CR=1 FL=1